MTIELQMLLALTVKHFICDFPLQAMPWQYRNKGTYGHPGGVLHASIHGWGTVFALGWFVSGAWFLSGLVLLDMVAHYHIDYAKMKLGAIYGLKPDNSEWFWILLGFDQLLHYLTYFLLVWLAVKP